MTELSWNDLPCAICKSPYLKTTFERVVAKGFNIGEIGTLLNQPPLMVLRHFGEWMQEQLQHIDKTIDRLDAALAVQVTPDVQLHCEPGTHWFRFDTENWTIRLDVRMYKKETHYECVDPCQ